MTIVQQLGSDRNSDGGGAEAEKGHTAAGRGLGFGTLICFRATFLLEDDVASLKWLSHFVDDSFSEHSAAAYPTGTLSEKPKLPGSKLPEPETPVTTCFKTPISAKARSKRGRSGGRVWSLVASPCTESPSSSTSSSSLALDDGGDRRVYERPGVDSSKNEKVCSHWRAGKCTSFPCPFLYGEPSYPSGPASSTTVKGFATPKRKSGAKKVVRKTEKLVSGIVLPAGMDKLSTGSKDETLRAWDTNSGQACLTCVEMSNEGVVPESIIAGNVTGGEQGVQANTTIPPSSEIITASTSELPAATIAAQTPSSVADTLVVSLLRRRRLEDILPRVRDSLQHCLLSLNRGKRSKTYIKKTPGVNFSDSTVVHMTVASLSATAPVFIPTSLVPPSSVATLCSSSLPPREMELAPLSEFYPWRNRQGAYNWFHPVLASRRLSEMISGDLLEKSREKETDLTGKLQDRDAEISRLLTQLRELEEEKKKLGEEKKVDEARQEELARKYSSDIAALRGDHTQRFSSLKSEHSTALVNLRIEMEQLKSMHAREMGEKVNQDAFQVAHGPLDVSRVDFTVLRGQNVDFEVRNPEGSSWTNLVAEKKSAVIIPVGEPFTPLSIADEAASSQS
ncbi:hypothetical protein F3Y22_tig00110328pilonHSYRG00157 [Hibiscus syriacus]|uniref:C3H1-type domain-containing protein n=1 Tax=Hibiscus syriacus TaxID=106335 RepID=A0A6A3B2V2_HIBSY|nr:hypothetical protein F3Y22_tig00110328pilonHSYRG00157 [Hibiscus syriacus]